MTGYGKTIVAYKGKKINVEIKSLNSKQLDLTTRMAPLYREKEMEAYGYVPQASVGLCLVMPNHIAPMHVDRISS